MTTSPRRTTEQEGAACRAALAEAFARDSGDERDIAYGQEQVVRYLERHSFTAAPTARKIELINAVLRPTPRAPGADAFFRHCCGFEGYGRPRGQCAGSAPDPHAATLAATSALQDQAADLAYDRLHTLQIHARLGATFRGSEQHMSAGLAAIDAADLAFGTSSRRAQAFRRELRAAGAPESNGAQAATESPTADPTSEQAALAFIDLSRMTGLQAVKTELNRRTALVQINRQRAGHGQQVQPSSAHMIFAGRPGTGKTTVARLYARALKHAGVLTRGHLVEVRRADLVSEHIGQTAPKTRAACLRALDGVLFIDDAYTLADTTTESRHFGREALAEVLTMLETYKGRLCVIMAGYAGPMGTMLEASGRLPIQFTTRITFADYSDEELRSIMVDQIEARGLIVANAVVEAAVPAVMPPRQSPDFANARSVRTALESALLRQAVRLVAEQQASGAAPSPEALRELTHEDFFAESTALGPSAAVEATRHARRAT